MDVEILRHITYTMFHVILFLSYAKCLKYTECRKTLILKKQKKPLALSPVADMRGAQGQKNAHHSRFRQSEKGNQRSGSSISSESAESFVLAPQLLL